MNIVNVVDQRMKLDIVRCPARVHAAESTAVPTRTLVVQSDWLGVPCEAGMAAMGLTKNGGESDTPPQYTATSSLTIGRLGHLSCTWNIDQRGKLQRFKQAPSQYQLVCRN
jgi:hypothetical protein